MKTTSRRLTVAFSTCLTAVVACSGSKDQPEPTSRTVNQALLRSVSTVLRPTMDPDFVPNELIIKLKGEVGAVAGDLVDRAQSFASIDPSASMLDKLNSRHGVRRMMRLTQRSTSSKLPTGLLKAGAARSALQAQAGLSTLYRVRLNAKTHAELLAAAVDYEAAAAVEYAVPNYLRKAQTNDPLYPAQWAHTLTSTKAAHDAGYRGNDSVTIAIIDSGVDYHHQDLASRIWHDENGNPGWDAVDIDVNSLVEHGYQTLKDEDYTEQDTDPSDYTGHGTACAGVAAGTADNGIGIAGVAPEAKIMPVRAGYSIISPLYGEVGILDDASIVAALDYAATHHADVINMSFGGSLSSQALADATQRAAASGAILVAAAGNDGTSDVSYPAGYPDVISVAATNNMDAKTNYSNYGLWVDLSAPGGERDANNQLVPETAVLTTVPTSGGLIPTICNHEPYCALTGTSFASPYVAGAVALLRAQYPNASTASIRGRLLAGTDTVNDPLRQYLGAGRVNTLSSLTTAEKPYAALRGVKWQELSGNRNGIPEQGEQFRVVVTLENVWSDAQIGVAKLRSLDASVLSVDFPAATIGNLPSGASQNVEFTVTVHSSQRDAAVQLALDVELIDQSYNQHEQTLAWPASTGVKAVTTSNRPIADLALSGRTAVYLRWDADAGTRGQFNLYTVDVLSGQETRVTNVPEYDYVLKYPSDVVISKDRVAYTDNRNGNFDLYLWQPASGEVVINAGAGDDQLTDISGQNLVWNHATSLPPPSDPANARAARAYEVYFLDVTSPNRTPVHIAGASDGSLNAYLPKVSGNKIIYSTFTYTGAYSSNGTPLTSNLDVYLYDLVTKSTTPVFTSANDELGVDLSDNSLLYLYQAAGTSTVSLRVRDLVSGAEQAITDAVGSVDNARISGRQVTWREDNHIFTKNLDTQEVIQISRSELGAQLAPRISGNRIAFIDQRSGQNLYLAELGPAVGDVNYDSAVNIVDSQLIASHTVGNPLPTFYENAADVNCDKTVSIVDAMLVAQYSVGNISWLPAGACSPD